MMENCFVPPSNEVVRNDNDIAATKANHGERLVGHPLTVAKKKTCLNTSVIIIVTGRDALW